MKRLKTLERLRRLWPADTQLRAKRSALVVVAVIFAGFGIYLLRQSRAAELNQAPATLSLMPASATLLKGDVINISVNANAVADIKAVVSYPADSLKLEAVREVCPEPNYKDAVTGTAVSGSVTITCKAAAVSGEQPTVAVLVFTALTDGGTASLQVTERTAVTAAKATSGEQVAGTQPSEAKLLLVPRQTDQPKVLRTIPNYKPRKVCSDPVAGRANCQVMKAVNADDSDLGQSAAASSGFGPKEWHTAYQLPCTPGGPVAAVCATPANFGPNTIAIVSMGGYPKGTSALENDVKAVTQKFGIPACNQANGCLKVVNQKGNTSPLPTFVSDGGDYEMSMDVTAAHEICQTCKILVVQSNDTSSSNLAEAEDTAAAQHPMVISSSWGGQATAAQGGYKQSFTHPGVPMLFASGDRLVDPSNASMWPAGFNTVVSVAGTKLQLNTDGTRANETVWSTPANGSGTGGGCSVFDSAPPQQQALPNWATAGCGTKRAQGDISLAADPSTGIYVVVQGQGQAVGGTSLATPLLAGMFGLMTQPIGSDQTGLTALYQGQLDHPGSFYDITSGNDCTSSTKTHCTAGIGFDTPSGLGAPKDMNIFGTGGSTTPPPTTPPPTTPPPTTPPPTTPPPTTPPPTTEPNPGDINGDGKVNITDMSLLLSAWGTTDSKADLDKSGKVDIRDLSTLLFNWS